MRKFFIGLSASLWCVTCATCVTLALAEPPRPRVVDSEDVRDRATVAEPLTFPPKQGTHLILPVQANTGSVIRFFWLVEDAGRLDGIDVPSLNKPTEKEGGLSRDYLQDLLTGKPMKAVIRGRDGNGLAVISIYDNQDRDISLLMMRAGHARAGDAKGTRP